MKTKSGFVYSGLDVVASDEKDNICNYKKTMAPLMSYCSIHCTAPTLLGPLNAHRSITVLYPTDEQN